MFVSDEVINEIKSEIGVIKSKKAEEMYQNKNIRIESIDLNLDFDMLSFKAHVIEKGKTCDVYLRINMEENNFLYAHNCSCSPYSYRDCEHVLAVLLEINNNPKYYEKVQKEIDLENKRQEQFIFNSIVERFEIDNTENDYYDKNNEVEMSVNDDIQIIPILKTYKNQGVCLSFKIGNKKMYKLKSIEDFYVSYINKKVCKYGENLTIKHSEESFAEVSKPFLKLLLKYGQSVHYANEVLKNKNSYYSTVISSANIGFEGEIVDDLFDILKSKSYEIELEGKKTNLIFINDEADIKFTLEELGENEYKLSLNNNNHMIFKGTEKTYVLKDNQVFQYDRNSSKDLFSLISMFDTRNKDSFRFEKEELIGFINNILPRIRNNISLNNLSEDVVEKYIPKNLGVKVYLDLTKKGDVLATVKYCYDNIEFEPFSKNIPKIPRDMLAENKVHKRFLYDGFVYNKNYESYLMVDEDKIYNFITDSINYYMEKYEVLISDEFKKREVKQPKISSLGVKIQNNLLNIDLIGLDFDPKELQDILQKYKLRKKYYRLKSGEFLNLEKNNDLDFIENLTEGMEVDYSSLSKGKIKIPVNRSLYLNKLLENINNVEITEDKEYKEIINNTENGDLDEEIELPGKLNANLRAYQKIGYKWLKVLERYKFGGILADDMGLGKTLQVIAVILEGKDKDKISKPSIVVCPSSLTLNWKNEIEKFAPDLKSIVINGTLKERKELINNIIENDIAITSYDLLKRDIDIYLEKNINFKYIIADEAQYIKNSNTQNAKSLKDLIGETRFALTGTPIENSLAELWSIFDYIMPGYLFSYSKFKREYESKIVKEQDENVMKRLKTMIQPFILRRTKKEVLTELPDKTITILKNEMEGEQEKIYLSYVAQTKKEIMQEIQNQGFEKSQIKILSLLTRLRQICCHPSLFIENYKGESSKLNQLLELVEDAISGNHKILLFSTYTSMFNIIEEKLNERNIGYYKLTGSTKVDERIKMVDEFNKNENIKIFLISLKAGGTGLNLTGADMVIHYDPWWNVSAENQATDRAYRIGQKNNVQVYKLITKNSIEEKINELQEKKLALIENVLDTNQTFVNKLSKEDIMSLFE